MKYFRKPDGSIFAFESDGSQDGFITSDMAPIGAAEMAELLKPIPAPIPSVVTMRQARLALLSAGLLANVNSAIDSMAGVDGDSARIEWEYAATVDRASPLVSGLTAALSLTTAQLDTLFTQASTL